MSTYPAMDTAKLKLEISTNGSNLLQNIRQRIVSGLAGHSVAWWLNLLPYLIQIMLAHWLLLPHPLILLQSLKTNGRELNLKFLATFAKQLNLNIQTVIERFLAIQAMGSETAKQDIKNLKQQVLSRPLPDKSALKQGLEFLEQVDLRNDLEQINQPWLRIWGRLDGLVPRHLPPKMPIHHDNVTDHIIKKASHAPFFSHQHEFSEVLLKWLRSL